MTVKVTGPRAVVAIVPTLTGYQPDPGALAVLALEPGQAVLATLCLPGALSHDPLDLAETFMGTIAHVQNAGRGEWASTVLVAYVDDLEDDDAVLALSAVEAIAPDVKDAVLVRMDSDRQGIARSIHCEAPDCCPFPITLDDADPILVAQQGVPSGSRDDLVRSVDLVHSVNTTPLADRADALRSIEAGTEWFIGQGDVGKVAALRALSHNFENRDAMLGSILSGTRDLRWIAGRAIELARSTDDPHALSALCVLCLVGGRPIEAEAIARRSEDNRLSRLMFAAIEAGLHPDDVLGIMLTATSDPAGAEMFDARFPAA